MAGSITGYAIGHTLLALPITVMVMGNALRSVEPISKMPQGAFAVTGILACHRAPHGAQPCGFRTLCFRDLMGRARSGAVSLDGATLPVHIFNSERGPSKCCAIATMLMTGVLLVGLASLPRPPLFASRADRRLANAATVTKAGVLSALNASAIDTQMSRFSRTSISTSDRESS